MELHRTDTPTSHALAASGDIGAANLGELRAQLLEALDGGEFDLLLDARDVTTFDDGALPALTAARSRAKYRRRRLVVIDHEAGPVSAALRRSGLRFRFPVYADPAAAAAGLAADRAALARHDLSTPLPAPRPAANAPARTGTTAGSPLGS